MGNLTCKIKQYIQPFERQLALQELRALANGPVVPVDGDEDTALDFLIEQSTNAEVLRDTLAYWHSVGGNVEGLTKQLRHEATSLFARNGLNVDKLSETNRSEVCSHLPNRRCLRYATHGLHEYRGKFFPQLVRALINVATLGDDAIVVDPMCGSGTTLVEARLLKKKCYGLDMNPLSVFVSRAKCDALEMKVDDLLSAYENLDKWLSQPALRTNVERHSKSLPAVDQNYLQRWFSLQTLRELDHAETAIRQLPTASLRNFYHVCLSNILRDVSCQKSDDLRIRRDETDLSAGETTKRFLAESLRSTKMVAAFLFEQGPTVARDYSVQPGDSRYATEQLPDLVGQVDVIVTSPPYATALPYIDTDRLSLIYLGLLGRDSHRALDVQMIGNREVTRRQHDKYWDFYLNNRDQLPEVTQILIDRIRDLNQNTNVGFRRKNLAALLAKYFFDMRKAIQEMHMLLRPGGNVFLVVGNNRTIAGGEEVKIQTANHLGKIAEELGFRISDSVSMEMLTSRDIFKKNAMSSEEILKFEKN